MALDIAVGAALISRRDGSGNPQTMGYVLRVPATSRVTFGVASASARNDALVAAAIDTTDGAIGAGAVAAGITTSGFHLLAVPGVSGTTTPRTDSQITTYLGRGGWIRLADVPIASSDTQINTANMVAAPASVGWYDSGNITNAFTPIPGFSVTSQSLRRCRGLFYFSLTFTRTGGDLTSGSGNIANTAVATWDTAKYPIPFSVPCTTKDTGYGIIGSADAGTIYVTVSTNLVANGDIAQLDSVQLSGSWPSTP
jgi:hypothetical protein